MLAEEVAVVAEVARALERLEEHADALVHRGHHARAQPHLLLAPGVDRRVELPRLLRLPQLESLGPRGLALHDLRRRQHVWPHGEDGAAVEILVPGSRA